MNVSTSPICGLNIGAEYVQADEEGGIDYPCLVIDLLVFRVIVEFTGE